jgi:hypothetical protein
LVFEQGIESRCVERRGLYRIMSSFVHVVPSAAAALTCRPLTLRLPIIRSACSARGCHRANQFWFARGMIRVADVRFF